MIFTKTKNGLHHFVDEQGDKYKISSATGTPEQALEIIQTQVNKQPEPEGYKERRKRAYANAGLTIQTFVLAMIQKEIDGDTTELEAYKAARAAIKKEIPKQ